MNTKAKSDLKDKTIEELEVLVKKLRMEIVKIRLERQGKNTNLVKNMRRTLAQALTIKNKTINNKQ